MSDCCDGDRLCFKHKLAYWRDTGGLNISPAATPTRRNNNPPTTFAAKNSWERGVAKDDRGMPYLDKNLEPMPIKAFGEKGRRQVAVNREKLKHQPPTSL
jgi:hypothetical protein